MVHKGHRYKFCDIFKPIDRRQGRERLESFVFEHDRASRTRASADMAQPGHLPTSANNALPGASSSGNHAHGGRTSAEAGGGLDAVDSFYVNKKTLIWQQDSPKNSLVPPAVYELSDNDWIDLEVIRKITNAIKIVQEELEGEKCITGSRVIPLLEGVRARLDSTRVQFENRESPSGKFVDLMLLMYAVILVCMLMVFMLFMCVVCVSFTDVMTLVGVSIMFEVIAAFELRFGDGTHLCRMREGPAKQPCGYTPVQVAAAFLDARNLPCNFLPPTQEPEGWNVLCNMLIDLINEDRVSVVGVATGAGGPGEETSWLDRCTVMTNFEVTAEEIADKEIGLWKLRTVPLQKTDDPLMEWKLCGDKNVCPFLGQLARRVLVVPATSA